MVNVQSPPGYLDINELLKNAGEIKFAEYFDIDDFKQEKKPSLFASDYSIEYTIIDSNNLQSLEDWWRPKTRESSETVFFIKVGICKNTSHRILSKKPVKMSYRSSFAFTDFFYICRTRHFIRQILSEGQLPAFCMHNFDYREIHKEFWHDDSNWYRLLADGCLYGDVKSVNGTVSGVVYFKENEVNQCLLAQSPVKYINISSKKLKNLYIERNSLKNQLDNIKHQDLEQSHTNNMAVTETTYLTVIAGLLDCILGKDTCTKHQDVKNQTHLVEILESYKGSKGTSKTNLNHIFAQANKLFLRDKNSQNS